MTLLPKASDERAPAAVTARRARFFLSVTALTLGAACGPKPPVRTALTGDLAALKRDIQSAQRAGQLTARATLRLAQAVGEREVMSAQGRAGAARVSELGPCAAPLRRTMERRAEQTDDVAAELGALLFELHAVDRQVLVRRYAASESGGFRALAARATVDDADADMRLRFFGDPDQRVRRAAFRAALQARRMGAASGRSTAESNAGAAELEAVLQAARVDPDPESQSLAVAAAGAIGGERAVLALKDLYASSDDALRIAIVDAWADRASFASGGERELWVAADHGGIAGVSAAAALVRAGGAVSAPAIAHARIRKAAIDGSDDEQRLALSVLTLGAKPDGPLDASLASENEAVIVSASENASPALRVVALRRLARDASTKARRDAALSALRKVAKGTATSESERRTQSAAVDALAEAGDDSVRATLMHELTSAKGHDRARAARGLAELGDYAAAATALADDDANVRASVACGILARSARD